MEAYKVMPTQVVVVSGDLGPQACVVMVTVVCPVQPFGCPAGRSAPLLCLSTLALPS